MKFPVKHQITLGFAVSVLALLLTGWLAYRTTSRLTETLDRVAHSHEIVARLKAALASLAQAEADQRGFLLTGLTSFLDEHQETVALVHTNLAILNRLTEDNPEQQQRLDKIETLVIERLALLEARIKLFQQRGPEAAADAVALSRGKALMDEIQRIAGGLQAAENQLLLQRERDARDYGRLNVMVIVFSSGLAIAIGLLAVTIIRRDLHLRERAEQELQEHRALLESILNHTPAMVFLQDLQGRYLFVNRRFAQVIGRPRAEIEGKTARDIVSAEEAKKAEEQQRMVLAVQGPVEFEETLPYPDGPRQHLAVKFPLRDAAGKIYATAGISSDVTERKKAEEERDRFFTLSLDLLCIASGDGYFKRVSPAVTDILGWSVDEFLARPYLEFVHPDDHEITRRTVAQQIEHGQQVLRFENRYQHKDGSWRVLSWCSMPKGQLMYAIARDVTEQKLAAEEIARLNTDLQTRAAQLETANKELESFSYSVSHDLRAPLRHIDGFVDLLTKHNADKLDDRSRRYLKIITEAARQMGNLIDDLLVFSRMGRSELRRQTVDMNALVHEAMAGLESDLANRNIHWNIATMPAIQADAAMLRQVWVNLIANAVKYTRPRDPAVIEIGCCHQTPVEIEFFVRDNGVGFDMTYAEKLFGVFQRLHRSEDFEGTGIGLANVRRIILRHGGRTWAEGKVDGGATFHFTLPKPRAD